ncbi:cytochrome b5, partial [Haematococcus lacustris]
QIMDGMVLDVTRWLPEHPGGSSIIPRQALNRDSSRFFEIYHATRESFLYLREFYRGEIHQDDIPCIPP